MKKQYFLNQFFLMICLFASANNFAQDDTLLFKNLKTLEDADTYIAQNVEASFLKVTDSDLDSEISKSLLKLATNDQAAVYTIKDSEYKLVDIATETKFKVSYIYFNGKKMTLDKINTMREKVIKDYNSGTSFLSLVKKYTMDGNATGDLGWISKGETVEKFEKAALAHKKGDIFSADVPENNWYYVVLKTDDEQQFRTMTFIEQPKK